jgi:hypothetical protein
MVVTWHYKREWTLLWLLLKGSGCPGCGALLVLPLFGLLQVTLLKKADASQYSQVVADIFWSARHSDTLCIGHVS